MSVDANTLVALKRAIAALDEEPHRPVPAGVVSALASIARPGLTLRLDVESSKELGAPLVTVLNAPDDAGLLAGLTRRQKEVADLILQGLPNRKIASRLGISIATVKDHVHAILQRLDLPSRAALIAASRPLPKI